MRAHIACQALDGVRGWRFGVLMRRVRRLRGFRGTEAINVTISEASQLGGCALGCIHVYGGGGGGGGSTARGASVLRVGEVALGCSPWADSGARSSPRAGSASA